MVKSRASLAFRPMTVFEGCVRLFIVEEGPNPSTDFFVLPALSAAGLKVTRCNFDDLPNIGELAGASVLFVRYVPGCWKRMIDKYRAQLAGVYFFMDDDLFDRNSFKSMPLRYQLKLFRYSWLKQKWLKANGARLLVSTAYLQQKYSSWRPVLLCPQAPTERAQEPMQTIFYHGSASHMDEIRWLVPVMEQVLTQNEQLAFEVIGNAKVNKLFRHLPRVHVFHPMKWPSYKAMLRRPGLDIGLAPLLDMPFNHARSYTKYFDITQAGAVGIYSENSVYGDIIEHQVNGLLLPMKPDKWVESILELAADPVAQERMLKAAQVRL